MSANANSSCAASSHNKSQSNKLEESDEDLVRVADMELEAQAHQPPSNSNNTPPPPPVQLPPQNGFPEIRWRGRNPVDKEHKRLKRLLGKRATAQQALPRKKVYVCDLESRTQQPQDINSLLEESIYTLINENTMIRKVLRNTRPKVDQSIEPKNDIPREP